MIPQGVLPFQYEVDKKPGGMTALAGLPLYLELAYMMGLRRMISEHVRARRRDLGWTDDQMIVALVLSTLVIVHRDISDRGERRKSKKLTQSTRREQPENAEEPMLISFGFLRVLCGSLRAPR
jgi:hypothetical protein